MATHGAQAQSKKKPTAPEQKMIVKKIDTIQDYLNTVDLERVYVTGDLQGASGLFIAVPSLKTAKSGGKRENVVAQYMKVQTNLALAGYVELKYDDEGNPIKTEDNEELKIPTSFRAYDDSALANMDQNGGMNYSCTNDGNAQTAKMDVAAINASYVASAPARALSDADKAALFGGTLPASLSADQQAKLSKAEMASGKLYAMATGFRMIPVPRGGIQTNCQAVRDSLQVVQSYAVLNRLVPLEGQQNNDVDVFAIWYNATEKDVVINGQTVKAVVDAKGNIVKADAVNVRNTTIYSGPEGGGSHSSHQIWVKRPDSKLHNSEQLVKLYSDLGYSYAKATTSANTGNPSEVPPLKFCGLVVKDKFGLTAIQDNQYDVRIYPKGTKISLFDKSTRDVKVSTDISDADLKSVQAMKCGCIEGVNTGFYKEGTQANDFADGISFPFLFNVKEGSVESKKISACKGVDKSQDLMDYYGGSEEGD